ncbi:MAG TPA: acyl-CoA thioesterase [Polyangiaceae bacterium]
MTDWIAAPPPPATEPARARVHLRYEDVSQDGRLLLELMPNALGAAVWSAQLSGDSFAMKCMATGVVPILTRFVIEGEPGPFGIATPLSVLGRFSLAQTAGERVFLNMWAELSGPIGRTYPPQPDDAGRIAPAGRIFGEHVFTRLFAPPGERRVRKLDVEGAPASFASYVAPSFATRFELPPGARVLGELAPDEAPVVFGLVHTDSNHHVNSLVYLRLFEEAALRRFASIGRGDRVLARKLEIAYRKPCFAGDRMRVHVHPIEHHAMLGAVCAIAPEGSPASDAHAVARLVFA